MYLDTLNIWNFRKYGIIGETFEFSKPGLTIRFNKWVNVLIRENDSGKTTILDAIRYVLKYIVASLFNLMEKVFHYNKS